MRTATASIASILLCLSLAAQTPAPAPVLHPAQRPPTAQETKAALQGKKLPKLENLDPSKAPYSLVSFMSSRCPHCANEAPKLAELERSISGESPTIGILKNQSIELIKRNKLEDAIAVLGDLDRDIKAAQAKPHKVGNLQIVPVFQKQDGGASAFLDSASWLITPAYFTNLTPEFTITGTPTTVLADREGTVKHVWVGEMQSGDYLSLRRFIQKPDLSVFGEATP